MNTAVVKDLKNLFADGEESDGEFHGFLESEIHGCSDETIDTFGPKCMNQNLFTDGEESDGEFLGFPESEIRNCSDKKFAIDPIELDCMNQNSNSKTSGYGSSDRELSSDELDSDDVLSDSDCEEMSRSKRDKAVNERRSLLESLMSDLRNDSVFKEMARFSPSTIKPKNCQRQTYRRRTLYLSRSLPPVTRRRSKLGDPNYVPKYDEESEDEGNITKSRLLVRFGPKRKLSNDSDGCFKPRKRHRSSLAQEHHIIPVEDVTEAMLNKIAKHSVGKEYNAISGTSCHQCRQKTMDTKSCCRNKDCVGVRGQFCGPCLQNRYGESVRAALLDPSWSCPVCRGFCNCSICRNRSGRAATGILIGLARHHGFTNVKDYLASLNSEKDFIAGVE